MKSSEDSLTQKPDLTIKAKNNTLEIVEASQDRVKIKSNCAGQVNGSLYSGSYNDTVEAIMMQDGTLALTIKYVHMTNRGEAVWGTGSGTRGVPDAKGIAKLTAKGTMWTLASRLSQLNGKGWTIEGEYNIKQESFYVRQQFHRL